MAANTSKRGEIALDAIRPTWAEIDLTAIEDNVRAIMALATPAEVMAVVKADAYGHGAIEVAKAVLAAGAGHLAVATADEGLILRQAGIDTPILVFGALLPDMAPFFVQHRLKATVVSIEAARALSTAAAPAGLRPQIHVKIDTGMGRMGVWWEKAPEFLEEIVRFPHIELEGMYTHFAAADDDPAFTALQMDRFQRVEEAVKVRGVVVKVRHAANSAGVVNKVGTGLEYVRTGLLVYGYDPDDQVRGFVRPALTWKSKVVSVKRIPQGTTVGYGRTYGATEDTDLAVVPVGYADGYNRRLSGCAEVLIHGRRHAVAGRVSMDQIIVVVDENVQVGDEVCLLGTQGSDTISAQEIADTIGTIAYEVLCAIGARVPRLFV